MIQKKIIHDLPPGFPQHVGSLQILLSFHLDV